MTAPNSNFGGATRPAGRVPLYASVPLGLRAACALAVVVLKTFGACAQSTVTNSAPGMPAALPDVGSSVLRVLGALALVIAIFLGGVWLFRNWQRLAMRKSGVPRLSVLEMKSLGQRQAIYVVGYQQQRMLLATSPAGVTLLSHLPAAEEREETAPATRPSFAEAFQMVINRKQ